MLILLLLLCLLTPAGILLPMVVHAGDAWGEWSAQTLNDLLGYIPKGLAKYSNAWQAPLPDYTIDIQDKSVVHQSGYYIITCLFGATLTYVAMLFISKLIIKNGK